MQSSWTFERRSGVPGSAQESPRYPGRRKHQAESGQPAEGYFATAVSWTAKEEQVAKQSFFMHGNYPAMNVVMASKEELLQQRDATLWPDSCCAKII
eukprot:879476-Pyramimonas_sp.AAC.1